MSTRAECRQAAAGEGIAATRRGAEPDDREAGKILTTASGAALTRLRGQCGSGGMAGADNRRPEQPICRDANQQEDRDHDRWNEVFQGFPRKVTPDRRIGVRSQHGVEGYGHEGKAAEHHHTVKIFLLRRTSLLSTRRGRPLACW
jgi:hypothetical protein